MLHFALLIHLYFQDQKAELWESLKNTENLRKLR